MSNRGLKKLYFREGSQDDPQENDCRIISDRDNKEIQFQKFSNGEWINIGKIKK